LTLHFCGGSLAGMSVISSELVCETELAQEKICCAKKSPLELGCCNDTVINLSEVDKDSLFDSSDIVKLYLSVVQHEIFYVFKNPSFKHKLALPNYTFQSNAPPLYKLYGTYIHYA